MAGSFYPESEASCLRVGTDPRCERLTETQKRCLRLVYRRFDSKEIAREIGLSPHTVDTYLKAARRTLDVGSRAQAARMLAEHEGDSTGGLPSQSRVSPTEGVAPSPAIARLAPPVNRIEPGPPVDFELREDAAVFDHAAFEAIRGPVPTQAKGPRRNDLTTSQRLGLILLATAGLALAAGMLLAGLTSLTTLVLALTR